eukprot:2797683-Alexandrium_andersonii.AAC.1
MPRPVHSKVSSHGLSVGPTGCGVFQMRLVVFTPSMQMEKSGPNGERTFRAPSTAGHTNSHLSTGGN